MPDLDDVFVIHGHVAAVRAGNDGGAVLVNDGDPNERFAGRDVPQGCGTGAGCGDQPAVWAQGDVVDRIVIANPGDLSPAGELEDLDQFVIGGDKVFAIGGKGDGIGLN